MKMHLHAKSHISKLSVPARAVTVAAIISILLVGCDKPSFLNKEDNSPLALGMKAVEEGDYNGAMSHFNSAVNDDTNAKLIKRGMGMAALGLYDYEGAINYFKEALLLSNGIIDDVDIDISYYLAIAEYKSGDIDGAISTYSAIVNMYPKEDNAYYLRGKANLLLGNKDIAISDYDRAIELSPNNYNHYVRICKDLREAGYESEGNSYIEKAMNSHAKLSDYQLGIFNYYLGDYTAARNNLENARNSKDNSEDLILYLGRTYEQLGDPGYAISLYESYLSTNPGSALCYLSIGMAKMQQKDYEGALSSFDAGLATGDESCTQSLLYNRIITYERLLDFETAKSLCAEYVVRYPDDEKAARENQFLSTR